MNIQPSQFEPISRIIKQGGPYQLAIGKLASQATKDSVWGDRSFDGFLTMLNEATQLKLEASTIRAYRVVWERIKPLLNNATIKKYPYTTLRWLVQVEDPKKWLAVARKQNWSSQEFTRHLKDYIRGGEEVICPRCYVLQPNKGECWFCHETLV